MVRAAFGCHIGPRNVSLRRSIDAAFLMGKKLFMAMTESKAIASIICGGAAIAASFVPVQWYYAKGLTGATVSNRPMPKWVSRVLLWVVGLTFILIGSAYLLLDQ